MGITVQLNPRTIALRGSSTVRLKWGAISGRQNESGPHYVYARIRPDLKQVAEDRSFAEHAVFLLDTSLIGADENSVLLTFFDKIHVRARRGKHFVAPDCAAAFKNVQYIRPGDGHDHVRHAAVDEMHSSVLMMSTAGSETNVL